MKSAHQEPRIPYQVRWRDSAGERIQQVEYAHYAQAEACFISLFSVVDRTRGGWAEIRHGERCMLDMSPDGGAGELPGTRAGHGDEEEAEGVGAGATSTRNLR